MTPEQKILKAVDEEQSLAFYKGEYFTGLIRDLSVASDTIRRERDEARQSANELRAQLNAAQQQIRDHRTTLRTLLETIGLSR